MKAKRTKHAEIEVSEIERAAVAASSSRALSAKSRIVPVRFSQGDYAVVECAASSRGISVSELIRNGALGVEASGGGLTEEDRDLFAALREEVRMAGNAINQIAVKLNVWGGAGAGVGELALPELDGELRGLRELLAGLSHELQRLSLDPSRWKRVDHGE
jgi:hypothetical protein